MVENMKANMANPNFFAEKEARLDEVRNEVLKKMNKKLKDNEDS